MTTEELRKQFEKEQPNRIVISTGGQAYGPHYGAWLESRLINAEQEKKDAAWEAWKHVVNQYEVHSINEKLERITFDEWYKNREVK